MDPRKRSSAARPRGNGSRIPAAHTLRAPLLRWYRRHARDLPWRRTDDPYAIWVSEVMLQQTRVEAVVPYYRRFLERFPDAESLARASEEEVLGMWSGLGYYRRARALHAAARQVVERHDGSVPRGSADLLALPGVGRYTAGAIASIAFGLAEPVLDGNVRRVLARVFAIGGDRISDQRFWAIAAELVRGTSPGDLNQALMELGATVCTPRKPRCTSCPLATRCVAGRRGTAESFPHPRPRPATVPVDAAVAVVLRGGQVLLERPSGNSPLRGAWDLPALELSAGPTPSSRIRRELRSRHGLEIRVGTRVCEVRHGIMQRRLRLEIYRCTLSRGRVAGQERLRWLDPRSLAEAAVSGATHKVLRALESAG